MPFAIPYMQAAATVDAGGTPVLVGRGFSALERTAAGNYLLTLDTPIDAADALPMVSLMATDPSDPTSIEASRPADETMRVQTRVAGVLTDLDFAVALLPTNLP